ncbi:patatin-like phospholipase family protein [Flaviflagellibacter deserti]|uniref:Patatin-like phospholipase family protein n=1 Tax=Flaviflagellibacter deserti TaxID=2267266 RepID=A0ABV9YX65_9HYPH
MESGVTAVLERASSTPRIAVALGGGGARGLAHVLVLEALDELGIRPAAIAGTSIGAIFGWAYASGLPAKTIRNDFIGKLKDRRKIIARLFEARVGRFTRLVAGGGNPMLIDAEVLLPLLMPEGLTMRFEDLEIPLSVVATDFHARCEAVFRTGPIQPAVAGSAAIPGLIRPVVHEGRVLIDGGAVNPLPFDLLFDHGDVVVAADVIGGLPVPTKPVPDPWEAMFGSLQILQSVIAQSKIARRPPDITIRPPVGIYRVLDFFKAPAILKAGEPCKDELKRALEKVLA